MSVQIDSATTADPNVRTKRTRSGRLLGPTAYSETAMPSLRLARSSRLARRIARALFAALTVASVLVSVAPWQQSVRGTGKVIAYDPLERQQVLETPIKGRIDRFGKGIVENAHVKQGQLIAVIADIDKMYFGRLEDQLTAARNEVKASQALCEASERNKGFAEETVKALEGRLSAYREVKNQVEAAADSAIESAAAKVVAEKEQLSEYQATLAQYQADFERKETLYNEKIVSQFKFQDAERKLRETEAKVRKANANVTVAEKTLAEKRSEREAKSKKAQVDIDAGLASLEKSNSDVAKAASDLAKAQALLTKSQKSLLETETKVERQRGQEIRAPFDGFITQITPNNGSQVLKEGDPICVIVPDTADRAVQVWLDGNDAPLVEPGRHVRLQFEGWPAVQFAGWPSVAVGTFGGEVISVDATDNGEGKFRVLVRPDKSDGPWPNERFLRQGVRANGWVLLEQVPLWYEIWRNMNGFPPALSSKDKQDKDKKPKLPKP